MDQHTIDLVAEHPVLGCLSSNEQKDLLESSLTVDLPAASTLFRQGDTAQFLYMVVDGQIALVGSSDGSDETVVEFFRNADLFILPAVILDMPYLMSARTTETTRMLMIPVLRFRQAMAASPSMSMATNRLLSQHWRLLIRQVKDLKLRSAPQRLGSYLLSLAEAESNQVEVELSEQRGMLARRLGMTPENLSRSFARLRESGVNSEGSRIQLSDVAKLREFCAYDEVL